jgi:hypothetical protein
MPSKHKAGGCGCCSPCGFGCDPCVGSVTVDAGDCANATWMYPLADPCTGIVTESDPFCLKSDCQILDCDEVRVATTFNVGPCMYSETCEACSSTYGLSRRRRVRKFAEADIQIREIISKKVQYEIAFLGLRSVKIKVTCSTYMNVIKFVDRVRRTTYNGECFFTSSPCPPNSGDPYTLVFDSGFVDCDEPACVNGDYSIPFSPACYGDVSPNYISFMLFNSSQSCSPWTIGSRLTTFCDTDFVSYRSELTGTAVYESTIELDECNDLIGTHTIPRITPDFSKTRKTVWLSVSCSIPCTDVNHVLDDCWPEDITVTIA